MKNKEKNYSTDAISPWATQPDQAENVFKNRWLKGIKARRVQTCPLQEHSSHQEFSRMSQTSYWLRQTRTASQQACDAMAFLRRTKKSRGPNVVNLNFCCEERKLGVKTRKAEVRRLESRSLKRAPKPVGEARGNRFDSFTMQLKRYLATKGFAALQK